MEFFYREMRRATGLLMEGDQPAGGRWNFDPENRKRPPKSLQPPPRTVIPPNPVTAGDAGRNGRAASRTTSARWSGSATPPTRTRPN